MDTESIRHCHIIRSDGNRSTHGETAAGTQRISRGALIEQALSVRRNQASGQRLEPLHAPETQEPYGGTEYEKAPEENIDVLTSPFRALAESCGFRVIREEESSLCSDGYSEQSVVGSSSDASSVRGDSESDTIKRQICKRTPSGASQNSSYSSKRKPVLNVRIRNGTPCVDLTDDRKFFRSPKPGINDEEYEDESCQDHGNNTQPRHEDCERFEGSSDIDLRNSNDDHNKAKDKIKKDVPENDRHVMSTENKNKHQSKSHNSCKVRRQTEYNDCNNRNQDTKDICNVMNRPNDARNSSRKIINTPCPTLDQTPENFETFSTDNEEDMSSCDIYSPVNNRSRNKKNTRGPVNNQTANQKDTRQGNGLNGDEDRDRRLHKDNYHSKPREGNLNRSAYSKSSTGNDQTHPPATQRHAKIFMKRISDASLPTGSPQEYKAKNSDSKHNVNQPRNAEINQDSGKGQETLRAERSRPDTRTAKQDDPYRKPSSNNAGSDTKSKTAFRISRRSAGSNCGVMRYFTPGQSMIDVNPLFDDSEENVYNKPNSCKDSENHRQNDWGGDGRSLSENHVEKMQDLGYDRRRFENETSGSTLEKHNNHSNGRSQLHDDEGGRGYYEPNEEHSHLELDDKQYRSSKLMTAQTRMNQRRVAENTRSNGVSDLQQIRALDKVETKHNAVYHQHRQISDHLASKDTCENQRTTERQPNEYTETSSDRIHIHGYQDVYSTENGHSDRHLVDDLKPNTYKNKTQCSTCQRESEHNHETSEHGFKRIIDNSYLNDHNKGRTPTTNNEPNTHEPIHTLGNNPTTTRHARNTTLPTPCGGTIHPTQAESNAPNKMDKGAQKIESNVLENVQANHTRNGHIATETTTLPHPVSHPVPHPLQGSTQQLHHQRSFNVNSNYEDGDDAEMGINGSRFIGQYFLELWKNQCLCDVRLRVGNWSYLAHKIVLAAFSDFFCPSDPHCMPSICFDIPNATPDAVHQILLYLYTSEMEITDYTLESVLCAAESLGVTEVINLVKEILDNPTPENLEHYIDIRTRHGFSTKFSDFTELVREHLLDVVTSPSFLEIDLGELQVILADPEVKVDSEVDIIDIIARWVEFSPMDRIPFSADLLTFVNFDCIPADVLADIVERKRHVFSRDAFGLFLEAFKNRSINAECNQFVPSHHTDISYHQVDPSRRSLYAASNRSTNADSQRPPVPQLPLYNDVCNNPQQSRPTPNASYTNQPENTRPTRRRTTRIVHERRPQSAQTSSSFGSLNNEDYIQQEPHSRPLTRAPSDPSMSRPSSGHRRFPTTQNHRMATPREIMSLACRGDGENWARTAGDKQHRITRVTGVGGHYSIVPSKGPPMQRSNNSNAIYTPYPGGPRDADNPPSMSSSAVGVQPVWDDGTGVTSNSPGLRYTAPPSGWSRASSVAESPWPSPGVAPSAGDPPPGCSTFRVVRGGHGPRWEQRSASPGGHSGSRSSSKRVTFM